MKKIKEQVFILSHNAFDYICERNEWDDNNVEDLTDKAFISIISSDECQKYYIDEIEQHWFKENHPNVFNLEFDDITEDIVYQGHTFSAMTEEQAKQTFDFIEKNIGKIFYVHCRAGISRSGAVGTFIEQMYGDKYEMPTPTSNRIRPNNHVLSMLKRCFYEKYGLFENNG